MNIKILGSSGFIGKHLLKSLDQSVGVSLREVNWVDKLQDADIIINLIGKAHDHQGLAKEEDYYYSNFELVKEIFNQFLNSDASLFIHISSIAAIEEIESQIPLTEDSTYNPISVYGISKMEAEKWLIAQKIPAGKKVIILRPPMVHGPFDKGNLGLLYKFVDRGIPYPLTKYKNERTFIYIGNFIYYIQQIIKNFNILPSGIYHVSDSESISTIQILEIMEIITNKKIIKIAVPKFIINLFSSIGDIIPLPINSKRLKKLTSTLIVSNSKLNRILGLDTLPYSAKDGLINTIMSFNDKIK